MYILIVTIMPILTILILNNRQTGRYFTGYYIMYHIYSTYT